jgi:osmotically-inducible protein OsmY
MKHLASTRSLIAALCAAGFLQACVPLVVAGVGTGVTSTLDRRTYGEQIIDREIEHKFNHAVTDDLDQNSSVTATAFHRWLLLTGQAIDPGRRDQLEQIARGTPNVNQVFNEVTIGYPASFSSHSSDSFITSKVKTRLFDSPYLSGHHVKVITESRVVYLMGELTDGEARVAVDVARNTSGVEKVVSVFEIISEEKAQQLNASTQKRADPPPASGTPQSSTQNIAPQSTSTSQGSGLQSGSGTPATITTN